MLARPARPRRAGTTRDERVDRWTGGPVAVEAVLAALAALPGHRAPILVAVDGGGGAGKSTLAAGLARRLAPSRVVSMDDFYRPSPDTQRAALSPEQGYERYFDWRRLEAQVLTPLRAGRPTRYQRYDWGSERLEDWVDVEPRGTVLVEGVYSMRPELAPHYDLRVWVETPEAVRMARQRARATDPEGWPQRWAAAEEHYARRHRPLARADLVVPGD